MLLRPPAFWPEVELLAYFGLLTINKGQLCPTAFGTEYLADLDQREIFEDFFGEEP